MKKGCYYSPPSLIVNSSTVHANSLVTSGEMEKFIEITSQRCLNWLMMITMIVLKSYIICRNPFSIKKGAPYEA